MYSSFDNLDYLSLTIDNQKPDIDLFCVSSQSCMEHIYSGTFSQTNNLSEESII